MSEDMEVFRKAAELEAKVREDQMKLRRAKGRSAERLDGMADQIMDTLQYALASEDEALRVKTALALLDRLIPKAKAGGEDGGEVIEVVQQNATVDEIEELLRKKMKKESESGGSEGGSE